MIEIPDTLAWWREVDGGAAWLDRLPTIVDECAARWSLALAAPIAGSVSLVVPATRTDGSRAALKVNFPERESECEPDALEVWDGVGAARLLERDDDRRALLVEWLSPGDRLWSVDDDEEATAIAATVLDELHRPVDRPHAFTSLAEAAALWASEIPADWESLGRPFERSLVDIAVDACRDLPDAPGVLLHQDFHGGNVLRDGDRWRAIDPKPLVGDPAFDAGSLLRDRRWLIGAPGFAALVGRRLDLLAERLELDRDRLRLWGVAHALAWGIAPGKIERDLVECARILATRAG